MATAPKSDVSPFLEAIRQQEQRRAPANSAAQPLDVPMVLLHILADGGPQPVQQLYPASGMDFTKFSEALNGFQEAGLVELTKRDGSEVVALTPSGLKLTSLATKKS
jgi:predicted transcriptional regulator